MIGKIKIALSSPKKKMEFRPSPKTEAALAEIGLRRLTPAEVLQKTESLTNEISLGLNRSGPSTEADGGLLAIPVPVQIPTRSEIEATPDQTQVLAGAFAGTNWQIGVVTFKQGLMESEVVYQQAIPQNERQFSGRREFAQFMAQAVIRALDQSPETISHLLAISFGFPQENVWRSYGLEAILLRDSPSKFWSVTNGRGMHVGEELLTILPEYGIHQFTKVFILNDTLAVALDRTVSAEDLDDNNLLLCGFVFGTGSNGCLEHRGDLVNLELGRAQALGKDPILQLMLRQGLVPDTSRPLLEYHTGGDYILKKLACALTLAREGKIVSAEIGKAILASDIDPSLVSTLAVGQVPPARLQQLLEISIGVGDFDLTQYCAQMIMTKAAQAAGIAIGAVAKNQGWTKGGIPVEGAVFWKGQVSKRLSFAQKVEETLDLIVPDHNFSLVPASGLRGIATLAMTQLL
jgi:hexokinase